MNQATVNHITTLDFIASEAINTISSNISFAGKSIKKILFTSYGATEGKSFVVKQIFWNLAKRGKRVILVDTDLRRSTLISDLEFKARSGEQITGLAHYLAGYCDLDSAIYQTNIANAVIMPIGRTVKNPIVLLGSQLFSEMLDILAEEFDYIIIDSPPIGLVIDAAEIAEYCDGAVIVVEYNHTRRRELITVRNQIGQTRCPILGCIINKVKTDTLGAKRYYNYSGYYGSAK